MSESPSVEHADLLARVELFAGLDRVRFLNLVRQKPDVALAIAATLSRHPCGEPGRDPRRRTPGSTCVPFRRLASARVGSQPLCHERGAAGRDRAIRLAHPPPDGLSASGWHALALLVAGVPVLAVDALPEGILALVLAGAWVLGGVAPTRVALAGFSSASWVLVVSVLAVGAGIASSGVLYRLALWTVARTRGGFPGRVLALTLAGVLMGPAVPNATGRVTMIAPALRELVEALGYAPGSRAAAGLSMAALIGFGQMAAVFLISSTTAVLVFAVLPPDTRSGLDWITWAVYAAPPNVLLLVGLAGAVMWLYRPRAEEELQTGRLRGSLELQRALLGPPSRHERISLAAGAALLLGFVTQPLHGAEPAWVAVLTLLCFAVSLVLRWQAAAPLITIALGPVAAQAGISPLVIGLVALIACNGFFLPYQSTTYLALYHGTGGELFSHAQARRAALAYGVASLLALATSVVF